MPMSADPGDCAKIPATARSLIELRRAVVAGPCSRLGPARRTQEERDDETKRMAE